ncbi:MAG: hypothetical protein BWY47_01252 [Bacteroidetes bacterium ADurb.Bin302]|nr:MAG: hypothetical protein BWY47_01252 [Bacteroidetes bacterium ADurb.Bin302]
MAAKIEPILRCPANANGQKNHLGKYIKKKTKPNASIGIILTVNLIATIAYANTAKNRAILIHCSLINVLFFHL